MTRALAAHPRSVWREPLRPLTVGLLLTVTLAAFEALAVATAMPVIGEEFGVSLYGWIISAFMLGNLLGIVVAGELIDRRGLLAPYLLGMALFGAGLTIGGLAPAMPVLIAGRAVQGIGAGAVPATAYVAIRREYPPGLRPTMFAYFSTAWILPGLVGPAIAGWVAQYFSWRLVFLGLLPLLVLALLMTARSLRTLNYEDEESNGGGGNAIAASPAPLSRTRILLAVRVVIGAGLLIGALSVAQPIVFVALVVAGLVVGVPGLLPLMPTGTLSAVRGLPATVLIRGVLNFGFTGTETFVPLALVSIRGLPVGAAGLVLTAATITWALGSWIQARWFARIGPRPLVGLGFLIVVAGILLEVPVLSESVPAYFAVIGWGVSGLGMGMAYPAISLNVLNLARAGTQGAATASLQLSDVLGTAFGAGVGGAIVSFGAASGWDPATTLLGVFGLMAAVVTLGFSLTGRVSAPGTTRA